MNTKSKGILSALLVILCAFSLVSCLLPQKSDEELIEERLNTFVDSFNSGDMDAVIGCFDKKSRNILQSAVNVGGSLLGKGLGFGVNMSDLFGLGIASAQPNGDVLSVTDRSIHVQSDTEATVDVTWTERYGKEETSAPAQFIMVKEGKDWYIKDAELKPNFVR